MRRNAAERFTVEMLVQAILNANDLDELKAWVENRPVKVTRDYESRHFQELKVGDEVLIEYGGPIYVEVRHRVNARTDNLLTLKPVLESISENDLHLVRPSLEIGRQGMRRRCRGILETRYPYQEMEPEQIGRVPEEDNISYLGWS